MQSLKVYFKYSYRILTGLAARQNGFLNVFTAGARQHQLRAGLIDLHHEVKVIKTYLPSSQSGRPYICGIRGAKGPRLQLHLVLVLRVRRSPSMPSIFRK